ncbi:MAG: hypothetical protein R3F36_16315 [Candidatus Competibacteraceae bacterium]
MTSLAGIKFTEMEPLYGDQYGQIAVSLNPAAPGVRGLDAIIEEMRRVGDSNAGPGDDFLSQAVRRSADRQADQRQGTRRRPGGATRRRRRGQTIVANIPGARDVADNDTPGRDELNLRVDVNAARNAGLDPGTVAVWSGCTWTARWWPICATEARRWNCGFARPRARWRACGRCWTIPLPCPAAGPRPWPRCW